MTFSRALRATYERARWRADIEKQSWILFETLVFKLLSWQVQCLANPGKKTDLGDFWIFLPFYGFSPTPDRAA